MEPDDCVDYEEANYMHTLMELHGYVVRYGHGRVLGDLQRLLTHEVGPVKPPCPSLEGFVSGGHLDSLLSFARGYRAARAALDAEELLSYDPRNFGPDDERDSND